MTLIGTDDSETYEYGMNSENFQSGLIMSLPVTLASVFREFLYADGKIVDTKDYFDGIRYSV